MYSLARGRSAYGRKGKKIQTEQTTIRKLSHAATSILTTTCLGPTVQIRNLEIRSHFSLLNKISCHHLIVSRDFSLESQTQDRLKLAGKRGILVDSSCVFWGICAPYFSLCVVLFTKWSQGQTQHSALPWTLCSGPLVMHNPNPLTRAMPTCLQRTNLLAHISHGQCIACTFSKKNAVVLKRRQGRQSSLPRLWSFCAAALHRMTDVTGWLKT